MNITLNKILIILGLLVVLCLGVYFAYYKISSLSKEIEQVKEKNTLLVDKSDETKGLYENLLSKIETRDKNFTNYIRMVDDVNKKHIKLVEKYSQETKKEQLQKVLKAKPALVEKIINQRINETFNCIQKATGDTSIIIPCHFN